MAENDIGYILFIFILFVTLGIALPFINQDIAFNDDTEFSGNNYSNIYQGEDLGDISAVTASISLLNVVVSVASMFFWTFGALPVFLDAFFVIIRIIFALLIYRLLRSGGG